MWIIILRIAETYTYELEQSEDQIESMSIASFFRDNYQVDNPGGIRRLLARFSLMLSTATIDTTSVLAVGTINTVVFSSKKRRM